MTDDANFTRHFYSVYFPASTVNSIRKKREKKKKKKKEKKRERERKKWRRKSRPARERERERRDERERERERETRRERRGGRWFIYIFSLFDEATCFGVFREKSRRLR